MSNAASRIKVTHYAAEKPRKGEKRVLTFCKVHVPVRETTRDESHVTCWLCREALEGNAT